MSQQSAFDRKNIEDSATLPPRGLMEQLNVPPAAAAFIRKNQRAIWIVVISVALVVTAVSLYGSYRSYREDKASSALTVAMKAQGEEKTRLLNEIVEEYGSTAAAMWSNIELAHMMQAEGDIDAAIKKLSEIKNSVNKKNPVTPLLIYNLGMLHEQHNDLNEALTSYNELLDFQGFKAIAYKSMGRVYDLQGNPDKALEMYKQYMETGDEGNGLQGNDQERSLIQARINRLEK